MVSQLIKILTYGNMTVRQLAVLLVIASGKQMRVRVVAQKLNVPTPVVTRAFDALENMGLMRRERSILDARDVFGIVTQQGRKLAESIGTDDRREG